MTHEELQKLYPGKEIYLIQKKSEQKYINFGFKTVAEFNQKIFNEDNFYCFMIEI